MIKEFARYLKEGAKPYIPSLLNSVIYAKKETIAKKKKKTLKEK